ncbi:MAG: hypothetical protein PHP17_04800 [Candidatus Omnitrophica bacterium]|nr:hypothetical protein [Candidatus Omnitrophota bacterium]
MSRKDFDEYVAKAKEAYKNLPRSPGMSMNINLDSPEERKGILRALVNSQILAQIALEKGLDKKYGLLNVPQEEKDFRLSDALVKDLLNSVTVSDVEINDFYEKHKEGFKGPDGKIASLSDVKRNIEVTIKSDKQEQEIKKLVGEFKARKRVEINEDLVN